MIKIALNISKIDMSRVRQGNTNPDNEYLTLMLCKMKAPDSKGYEFSITQSQTIEEVRDKAKKNYVGKGKRMNLSISDEDNSKFFMLFVEGGGAPTTKHYSLKTAVHEGNRLAALTGKDVYIMELSGIVAAANVKQEKQVAESIE